MGLAQVYYPHYICFARVLLAPCFLTMWVLCYHWRW